MFFFFMFFFFMFFFFMFSYIILSNKETHSVCEHFTTHPPPPNLTESPSDDTPASVIRIRHCAFRVPLQ